MTETKAIVLSQHQSHPRDWRRNLYVYPVISRRSGGLSIGINLNPDTACNFDCIYCQVDRSSAPRVRRVDPKRVRDELEQMIAEAKSGALFQDPAFRDVPAELRRVSDIAFSGDGEPTTCKHFRECVEAAAAVKHDARLADAKIVLITDCCYLTRPEVAAGLAIMDASNGEIWAKLDAGTEAYYRMINRPNFPLQHVVDNIVAAARVRPIVIQSLFMRVRGEGPGESELFAYADRLSEIMQAGGQLKYVQVYTIARPPAERYAAPLANEQIDHIVEMVRTRTGLTARPFYGAG